MSYKQHYVWSVLLRLFHWSFALSIVALTVTGFYIHYPWTNTLVEGGDAFTVGTMRYIHFVAGFVFTGSILARLYLLIFGNRNERVWDFLPVTPKKIRSLFCTMGFYLYCTMDDKERLGHNMLAGTFYVITFIMALLQVVGGFYLLYPESAAWQGWGLMLLGAQQQARFIHYLLMWYFILFAFIHVYIVIWNDIKSKEGLISSIFNGTKYHHHSS